MDQIEELDVVAAYCYPTTTVAAASAVATTTSSVPAATAVTATASNENVDCLEKALGLEFSDPSGVVQRQLLAK